MKKLKVFFCLCAAGFLSLLGTPIFADNANSTKAPKTPELDLARQLNQAFIQVADRISPAVVVITVVQKASSRGDETDDSLWDMLPDELRRYFEQRTPRGRGGRDNQSPAPRRRGPTGRGSGIVMSEDGYILTNNHVVEDAEKITVRFRDGREFKDVEIKGRDPKSDMAVLKIKDAKNLAYAKFGDSSAARVGEFVLAIGAPFDLDYSVTVGHISAKGRALPEIAMTVGPYADQDFIQTDASINPGNSGGPLVNLYGEVIGINTAIRGIGTGIGFAVPSNIAKQVSDHLIKEGKFTRSRIGIEIRDLREDPESRPEFPNVEDGVVVRGILSDGPAAKSELKAGDLVTAVDGRPVKTSRELKEQISYKKPGETATLDVIRPEANGKTRTVKVKVKTESLPDEQESSDGKKRSTSGESDESGSFGLSLKPLTKDLADEYGIDETQGLVVTAVEPGSIAEEKGIKPGDVVTGINRQPVSNLRQFRDAMKTADKKRGVIVNYISKGSSRFTVLREE